MKAKNIDFYNIKEDITPMKTTDPYASDKKLIRDALNRADEANRASQVYKSPVLITKDITPVKEETTAWDEQDCYSPPKVERRTNMELIPRNLEPHLSQGDQLIAQKQKRLMSVQNSMKKPIVVQTAD